MRPRTVLSPTRNDGALRSGSLKDAFTRMRVSLTCGSMCSTLPASQVSLLLVGTLTDCANNCEGIP
jgi:hypothetical protein